jgi:hypothetical protein
VDLVNDDVRHAPPVRLPARLTQEQRQTLGRRDQNVGRTIAQLAPLVCRRVSSSDANRHRALRATESLPDSFQRNAQITLDVVIETTQGGDVNALDARLESPRGVIAQKSVEDRQEGGEGLARAGRRHEQHVRARGDHWPRPHLRRCRSLGKRVFKPGADGTREQRKRWVLLERNC